jgi:hypothetical protein
MAAAVSPPSPRADAGERQSSGPRAAGRPYGIARSEGQPAYRLRGRWSDELAAAPRPSSPLEIPIPRPRKRGPQISPRTEAGLLANRSDRVLLLAYPE